MKEFGLIAVFSVAVTAAAPTPRAQNPAPFVTSKSTEAFARCFTDLEERDSAPWWFVPNQHGGGTFSNLGGDSVRHAYFVSISDRGARREIQLHDAPADGHVAAAVSQCI